MNTFAITRTRPKSFEGCTPLSNDERRALWAQRYYGSGRHQPHKKPHVRVKPRIRIVND